MATGPPASWGGHLHHTAVPRTIAGHRTCPFTSHEGSTGWLLSVTVTHRAVPHRQPCHLSSASSPHVGLLVQVRTGQGHCAASCHRRGGVGDSTAAGGEHAQGHTRLTTLLSRLGGDSAPPPRTSNTDRVPGCHSQRQGVLRKCDCPAASVSPHRCVSVN